MELELKQIRNTLLVRVKGEMDMLVAEKLRKEIDRRLETKQITNLVINLDKVTFIDSSGLGVIIGRYKKISSLNGKMFIVGASPSVRKILMFSGINKLISMYNNEQDIISI
ncbi:MAG: anti-sigma F factor antagonist [Firmicutes bacterium HGW-Firmicutes-15]|nr:MAG: anti-sigma F factor antagonist [Firmicutes bacterium HGW-Firmicutes-15]